MKNKSKWVLTWAQAHSALSLTHFIAKNTTYRLVVNSAISGSRIRVRLSNEYSKNDVKIDALTFAVCDKNGNILSDSDIMPLSVNMNREFVIKAGQEILCDEIDCNVKTNDYICISVYVTKSRLENGNALVNAKLLYEKGNHTVDLSIKHKDRTRTKVLKFVTGLLGIAQPLPIPLFESIELYNEENAHAIILLGDSITQQGKWSTPFEERIRCEYPSKYSVINKSITGNRILRDCSESALLKEFYGISVKKRLERDVLRYDNVSHVIFDVGINDIIQPGSLDARKSEKCTADELVNGVNEICERIKEKDIKLVLGNYIPFGRSMDGKSTEKERIRIETNEKLAATVRCDCFIDWSSVFEDKTEPKVPPKDYVERDGLHPSDKGGKVLADAIDISIFK